MQTKNLTITELIDGKEIKRPGYFVRLTDEYRGKRTCIFYGNEAFVINDWSLAEVIKTIRNPSTGAVFNHAYFRWPYSNPQIMPPAQQRLFS